jgi:hypothetical protein
MCAEISQLIQISSTPSNTIPAIPAPYPLPSPPSGLIHSPSGGSTQPLASDRQLSIIHARSLLDSHLETGDDANLQEAVTLLQATWENTAADDTEHMPMVTATLCSALHALCNHKGILRTLEEAISCYIQSMQAGTVPSTSATH